MADVHTPETRSFNMSRIRGQNTKPELMVRRFLFANGFRFRLHDKKLPGKPDIKLQKYKTVIFIHGCFWHGHTGCKYYVIPKTRTEWWLNKINKNRDNDAKAVARLTGNSWHVITLWECELKKENLKTRLLLLVDELKSQIKQDKV